jgi:hypothetical protein
MLVWLHPTMSLHNGGHYSVCFTLKYVVHVCAQLYYGDCVILLVHSICHGHMDLIYFQDNDNFKKNIEAHII